MQKQQRNLLSMWFYYHLVLRTDDLIFVNVLGLERPSSCNLQTSPRLKSCRHATPFHDLAPKFGSLGSGTDRTTNWAAPFVWTDCDRPSLQLLLVRSTRAH